MQRAVKPTGEWCAPTAELAKPKLLALLHSVKTTPDEAELEIQQEAEPLPELSTKRAAPVASNRNVQKLPTTGSMPPIVIEAEVGEHPDIDELSPEDEHALAEAAHEAVVASTGLTGSHTAIALEEPRAVSRPRTQHPAPSPSVFRTLFAILLVLAAATGGVLVAMNVVSS